MYEKTFESTKTAPTSHGASAPWTQLVFVYPWDAFLAVSLFEWARIFRDGTKITFVSPSGGYTLLGRVGGYAAFWTGDGTVFPAYEIDQLPNPNEVLNPAWKVPYMLSPAYSGMAFVDDRRGLWVKSDGVNTVSVYSLASGEKVRTINHGAGDYFKALQWVQDRHVAGITAGGKVRIIDYVSGAVVETGRIDPHRAAAYDCAFHVLVSVGTDDKVRVYCREAWPYALSAPELDPGVACPWMANALKVRLTGQDGEPCPGWWVHWALEGASPIYGDPHGPPVSSDAGAPLGCLDKYVSKTDQDGYAWNTYWGPDAALPGTDKIKAHVVVN